MSTHALQSLTNLMLAQAQECVWQKAAIDQLRDGTIARLASKVAEYYDAAYELATNSSIQNVFPKSWSTHMQVKALHFNAASQFRKACECISQNRYGEEIARLQLAQTYTRRAFDLVKSFFNGTPNVSTAVMNDLRSLQQIIQTNLARAIKDNDIIYLEVIPSASSLSPIPKSGMVKPVPPKEISDPVSLLLTDHRAADIKPHPVIGLPLFQKLVPFAVHQAASVYVDRKDRVLKEDIIARLEELTAVYHSTLQSLGIPSLMAIAQQKVGLPETLVQQGEEVRQEGGSALLFTMWDNVQKASAHNGRILDEAFNALDEEHELDETFRLRYKEKWVRPPSSTLTAKLVAAGQKHRTTLVSAQKADQIVRGKLNTWAKIIDVLVLPRNDLEASIPSATDTDESRTQVLARIKHRMEDMHGHLSIRRDIVDRAKKLSNADDISPALLRKAAQLTAKSPIVKIDPAQFEDLFVEELRKYDELLMKVDEEDEYQADVLRRIGEDHHAYMAQNSTETATAKREKALQNLGQAYVKFKEIKTNLSEGIKFYGDHANGLLSFRDTCIEYNRRRRLESDQIIE
ncbi:BRO1-like domain-containing protein [Radiomyces spectabilis]|uniref:BRO1-like domain-containing protein n=1 Tax=Radiomyces spectabilis TaxID=64574 RepID=UPI0022200B41|nr:BRO1-like domain-containing protein [Radiomyces spectabilis]KAI8378008.1 BRO1-like domain-containing protein [Radiomyces spectabilis]